MPNRPSPAAWAEIAIAYGRGAPARALAAQWGVTTGAIYRRAAAEGWSKKKLRGPTPSGDAPASPPATHGEHVAYPQRDWWNMKRPLETSDGPKDLMADILDGEWHEPGFLGRLATIASGRALMNYDLDGARHFIRLADDYERVAGRGRRTNLHTVMRAIFDRPYADALFKRDEGETNFVKDLYWQCMGEIDAKAAGRAGGGETGEKA